MISITCNKLILIICLSLVLNHQSVCQSTNDSLALVLDEFILEEMSTNNFPAVSASIVKEGQLIWRNSYGTAHIQNNKPATDETEYTLASISKLFTVMACLQLWEQGTIDIDADINNYLDIEIINPNHKDVPITVRQLMLHKSSLKDSESDLQLWDNLGDPEIDLASFCSRYFVIGGDLYKPSNWNNTQPGESEYWYSNAGFTLLGYIVESASNIPYNEFCKTHIFEPLEMNSTGWFYSEVDSMDMAMPYNNQLQAYGYFSVPEYPAAMMKSNILELSNFLIAICNNAKFGDRELISASSYDLMLPEAMVNGFGWWGKDTWYGDNTGSYWSHGGFMNDVRTQLNFYPEENSGLIILTNGQGNYGAIQNKMESMLSQFELNTSSTEFLSNPLNIQVSPNPFQDQIRLTSQDGTLDTIEYSILSIKGQTLERGRALIGNAIDVSALAFGKYIIELNFDGKTSRMKIFKSHQ